MEADVVAKGISNKSKTKKRKSDSTSISGATSTSAATVSVRIEDKFEVTPVFTVLKTTANGMATFNFTAPDSLSTYTIRAYASTSTTTSLI